MQIVLIKFNLFEFPLAVNIMIAISNTESGSLLKAVIHFFNISTIHFLINHLLYFSARDIFTFLQDRSKHSSCYPIKSHLYSIKRVMNMKRIYLSIMNPLDHFLIERNLLFYCWIIPWSLLFKDIHIQSIPNSISNFFISWNLICVLD